MLEFVVLEEENQDNYQKLSKVFNLFSFEVAYEIRKLLGNCWLEICVNISYFEIMSQFVRIFYNVLLDVELIRLLVSTFMFPTMCNCDMVFPALDSYHFDVGTFYYGGFLPCHELLGNRWYGQLLFELRMGLICDTLDDTLACMEFHVNWVPAQIMDKALVIFVALHSLLSLSF